MNLLNFDEKSNEDQTKVINTPLTLKLYKNEYNLGEKFRRLDVFPTKMPGTVFTYYPKNQEELQKNIDLFKEPPTGGRRRRQTKRFRQKRRSRQAKSRRRRA